jgi:hypothetical protein
MEIFQHSKAEKSPQAKGVARPTDSRNQDIVPLTTKEDLRAEGKEQNNCVGSYARKVMGGTTYIYKVLNPERATVAITVGSDGFWRRAELECYCNQPVSWLTEAKVHKWLAPHSLPV